MIKKTNEIRLVGGRCSPTHLVENDDGTKKEKWFVYLFMLGGFCFLFLGLL
jgi:hypothetical protein